MENFKKRILRKVDKCNSFSEKLELLNGLYEKSTNEKEEEVILEMISTLRFWGK